MFEVEKPRRFHYEPRFYDPEKEKWEALKKKYAIEQEKKKGEEDTKTDEGGLNGTDNDLQYFEQRLKDLDKEERAKTNQLTWRDLFRKREMPKFNYQPRFVGGVDTKAPSDGIQRDLPTPDDDTLAEKYRAAKHQIKIKRRFDISDSEYMKPISGTKIILYCFIVFLLISLIVAF